jgi:hypothetical protein
VPIANPRASLFRVVDGLTSWSVLWEIWDVIEK